MLEAARHKSKREVEHLVARLRPQPDVPSTIRKLPQQKPVPALVESTLENQPSASPRPSRVALTPNVLPIVKPLAPERYKIQFTVSRETYEQLRRAQDLLRHAIPNGDPAAIFELALSLLVAELSRTKLAEARRPRASRSPDARSRHIPAAVKRTVWQRDGGQCVFKGTHGRCTETGFLEYHHLVPFAAGGETTADNLELRCRAHNAYEAEQFFGRRHCEQAPLLRETRDHFWTLHPVQTD